MMVEFVHWCVFYYELKLNHDDLDDEILLDDVKLDLWLKKKKAKRRKDEIEARASETESSIDSFASGKNYKSKFSFE